MKYPICFTLVTILAVTLTPWLASGVSVEEDLTLTAAQKRALDRFKAKVINKLPVKYMTHDIHLIRFLRAKSFDVNRAEEFILEDIKWRKANSMNKIHVEDFSDIEEDYKSYVESFDREGQADKIMLINTPPVFEVVLSVIRPLMSPLTRRALKVYNQEMSQWQPELFKYVSPDQLPPEYGGTKIYTGEIDV